MCDRSDCTPETCAHPSHRRQQEPDYLPTKVGDHVLVRHLNAEWTGEVVGYRADEDEPYPLTLVRLDSRTGSTVPVRWTHVIEYVAR